MPDEPTIPLDPARPPELAPTAEDDPATRAPPPVKAPASDTSEELQRHLPQYRVRELVGRGGMGHVLKVDDPKLARTVALKTMKLGPDATEEERGRFVREATVLAKLAHPNIVPIYDLGADDEGSPFYTMKLVKGRTLQAIIKDIRDGVPDAATRHSLDRLLGVFRKVCDAIAFAHSKGILHRDLKPENIMVGEFGEVLVMDWGLAKFLDGEQEAWSSGAALSQSLVAHSRASIGPSTLERTLDGSVMGTPQYMSPEQAEGKSAELDERSDIFSLGAILYAILTLHPPVEGKSVNEVLRKISAGEIVPPSAFGAKKESKCAATSNEEVLDARVFRPLPHCPGGRVPAALSAVTMKALSADKARRYQSVNEFGTEVEAWQGGFATGAEHAGFGRQFVLLVKRHKPLFGTAAAAWFIITALAVWFVIGIRARERRAVQGELTARLERNRAENETVRANAALERAESTLHELRGTAPTFAAQAGALVEDGKLGEALEKITYATGLDPRNPDHHLRRANYLQALQRLADAEAEYREVLARRPDDSAARQNLALCQRLRAESGDAVPLPEKQQRQLLDALLAQGRLLEGIPLSRQLGDANATAYAELKVWLKPYMAQPEWKASQLGRLPDGTFRLDFSHLILGDLSQLQSFPISDLSFNATKLARIPDLSRLPLQRLILSGTQITDLSPLRGLKLRELKLAGCKVSDLSPLAGMPLGQLHIYGSNVTDLSPLRGAPLRVLIANNTIRDLGPLTGMPLEELNLFDSPFASLEPLRGAPLKRFLSFSDNKPLDASFFTEFSTLEEITLPPLAYNVDALHTLPKLQHIAITGVGGSALPAPEFWAAYQPNWCAVGTVRHRLDEAGVKLAVGNQITRHPDGTLHVYLGSTNPDRLDYFRGFRVAYLEIVGTKVHDIELLRGQPLTYLRVDQTAVTDLSPLLDCPILEKLTLPGRKAQNVELLRQLPKLRRISYRWDSANHEPAQSAEEFWKEYDAQHPAGKK